MAGAPPFDARLLSDFGQLATPAGRNTRAKKSSPKAFYLGAGGFHARVEGNEDERVHGAVEVGEDEAKGMASGLGIDILHAGENREVGNVFDG